MQHRKDNDLQSATNVVPFVPDGDFYFTKGIEAFKKRKFELALKWMKKAVEKAPNFSLYQCQLSVIYTEIGLYHEANKLLNDILQHHGEVNLGCYYLLANNYAQLGLLSEAKKYAQLYLEKDGEGDFSEVAFDLLELLKLDEEDWDSNEDDLLIYQETVFYHMEHKQWEKAYPLLKEMIMLFPEHEVTKHDLAYCSFYLDKEEEAIATELELISEESNLLYSYLNLALFYYEKNNKQESDYYISALLNVYPVHEHQKLRVATVLSKTGYYSKSIGRFQVLSKGMIKSHISYFQWYSIALFNEGYDKKSRVIWEEGCLQHPDMKTYRTPWDV